MKNLLSMICYCALACVFVFLETTYVNDPSWRKDCLAERIVLTSYLVGLATVCFFIGCIRAGDVLKEWRTKP